MLLDQNLSPRLAVELVDAYPGTVHVRDLGLARADDEQVWQAARDGDFLLVSKDADFHQRSFLRGHPPKVVWIRLGNCETLSVRNLLLDRQGEISRFVADPAAAFLALG